MQQVVETFFLRSVEGNEFTDALFPKWIRATLNSATSNLKTEFQNIHALLYSDETDRDFRNKIYLQVIGTNEIESLCNGSVQMPNEVIDWTSPLGIAIAKLMLRLYKSLDLAVFRKKNVSGIPTHQLYSEFIKKNFYVCPFCSLDRFKNRKGGRREDFDHYLHKSKYPLAAANMKNLVPTCGTCNQDHKKCKDVLSAGTAFYPYANVPQMKVTVKCEIYPSFLNLSNTGKWTVDLSPAIPDNSLTPKMKTWNRIYGIKKRLENHIQEFFEDWMKEVSDDQPQTNDTNEYAGQIEFARNRAGEISLRRMEPCQILKRAFYDFMLTHADRTFIESFRIRANLAKVTGASN